VVYIKLENNMDKYMVKYQNLPRAIKKISFKSKCKNGKFKIEKFENKDCITLLELNDRVLKKLKNIAQIRCWKNICVSENLINNDKFIEFAHNNSLRVMNGRWLLKNMVNEIVEYIVDIKKEIIENQEITIFCNKLDEIIIQKIKEICVKVKICNILSENIKQYHKLEEEIYQTNGIILNVSNNYKRSAVKSNIIINFDFTSKDLEKCILPKNGYIINTNKDIKIDKKEFGGKNIVDFQIEMSEKYLEYQEKFEGFDINKIYESIIYKKTNPKNITNEIIKDNVKILYLQDVNGKIIKNPSLNLAKTLDKITI